MGIYLLLPRWISELLYYQLKLRTKFSEVTDGGSANERMSLSFDVDVMRKNGLFMETVLD